MTQVDNTRSIFSMKELNKRNSYLKAFKYLDTILSVISLLLALQFVSSEDYLALVFIGLTMFIMMSLSRISNAIYIRAQSKLTFICSLIYGGLYLLSAALLLLFGVTLLTLKIVTIIFFLITLANRIISMIKYKKFRAIIINVILIICCAIIILILLIVKEPYDDLIRVLLSISIILKALFHIIASSFQSIRLSVLQKVIRRTYASEILFGLLMLIVSFSLVLTHIETGFENYTDALWYCFSVVTTIGLGDYTTITPIGRILTIILALYGIVVVAVITSVFVNFYNEIKNEDEKNSIESDKNIIDEKKNNVDHQ